MTRAHDPRTEATRLLPPGHVARVLEPSPPTHPDSEWWADDPTDPGDETEGVVVSPVSDGDVTWDEMLGDYPELAGFATDHWLGGHRRLAPLPPDFAATRTALHQLAFFVLAPTRYAANGKLGLRFTVEGFGTPFFGDDEQVRMEGGHLVHQRAGHVDETRPKTLTHAAGFLGLEYRAEWFDGFHDPPPALRPDQPLDLDEDAMAAVADWFGFSTWVLEELRRTPGAREVDRVQLWPEHFDPAMEMGSDTARAGYGASPGDDAHPEPYLYVAPWTPPDRDPDYWNDQSFGGASLPYSDLLAASQQGQAALDFLRQGHRLLTGNG